jgi:hypothetical protein
MYARHFGNDMILHNIDAENAIARGKSANTHNQIAQ